LLVQPVLQADDDAQIAEFGQALVVGVHWWVASQSLLVSDDPVQESAAQDVASGGYWQLPAPSHLPF
jgi:hypothetical protein